MWSGDGVVAVHLRRGMVSVGQGVPTLSEERMRRVVEQGVELRGGGGAGGGEKDQQGEKVVNHLKKQEQIIVFKIVLATKQLMSLHLSR